MSTVVQFPVCSGHTDDLDDWDRPRSPADEEAARIWALSSWLYGVADELGHASAALIGDGMDDVRAEMKRLSGELWPIAALLRQRLAGDGR